MIINRTLHTDGSGYWSGTSKGVKITRIELDINDFDETYGELLVYFDTKTWDPAVEGLIYTDRRFIKELRELLAEIFGSLASNDVHYSEQGMQGSDYVSLDAGELFTCAWIQHFSDNQITDVVKQDM